MSDFIKRLEKEHKELNEKIVKLREFIDSDGFKDKVSSNQVELLKRQYEAMAEYEFIIKLRLTDLNSSVRAV